MATKLFVGGLPFSITEEELKAAFAESGTVLSAIIIKDKMSGRSKGFGFVEYGTPEEAKAAIEKWHGKDMGGRNITVNEAKPMEPRAPRNDRY